MLDILQNNKPNDKMRTLKKRAQFLRAAKGSRVSGQNFTLQMIAQKTNLNNESIKKAGIGYTITKKVGNSPERNRIKRRLRAVVLQCQLLFKPEYDYVLIGRRATLSKEFSFLVSELEKAIYKIHTQIPNKRKLT